MVYIADLPAQVRDEQDAEIRKLALKGPYPNPIDSEHLIHDKSRAK